MFYEHLCDILAGGGTSLDSLERRPVAQLVYIHGSGCTQDSFRDQAAFFAGSDPVSLPGHPDGGALESVADYAQWFSRYVESARGGRVIACGNSLGGAIALRWALDFPEQAAGLILIGTGARLRVAPEILRMIEERWPDCIETLASWSLSQFAGDEVRRRYFDWHQAVGQKTTLLDYQACDTFDIRDELASLQIPTLVLVGSDDKMTPPKYSTYLNERISGSTLAVIPNAGHLAMAERPVEINDRIAAFLNSLS